MSRPGARRGKTSAQLRDAIDRGATGSKVPYPDPAAAPLGTDDEAAGFPPDPDAVHEAYRQETGTPAAHDPGGRDSCGVGMPQPRRLRYRWAVAAVAALAVLTALAALIS
jgi:hypothetical protein